MAGPTPGPEDPAPEATVVQLRVPSPRMPGTRFHMADLGHDVAAVVVTTDDGGVYLFPPEIFSLAADLVSADPASLVQAGAGLDVTIFFADSRTAGLGESVASCRAHLEHGRSWNPPRGQRRRRPGVWAARRSEVSDAGGPDGDH